MPAPNLDELGVQFTTHEDGTLEYKLPTGAVYKGTIQDIAAELAKSQIHASNTIRETKAEKERAQAEYEQYRQTHPEQQRRSLSYPTHKLP